MDFSHIISGAILGAIAGGLGAIIGKVLAGDNQANSQKYVGVCVAVCVVVSIQLNRTGVGAKIRNLISPPSLMAKAAEKSGTLALAQSSQAQKLFKKWGVNPQQGMQRLSAMGIKTLDYKDLVEWNAIRMKIAQKDPKLCSGFITGRIEGGNFVKTMEALGEPLTVKFMKLSTKGAKRILTNAKYKKINEVQMVGSMRAMAKKHPKEGTRILQNIQKAGKLSDSEACWTYKSWSKMAQKMGKKHNEVLLRAMTQ